METKIYFRDLDPYHWNFRRYLLPHIEGQHSNTWSGYVKLVVCKTCQDAVGR